MKTMHLLALGAGALLATAAAAQMAAPTTPDETQRAVMRMECEWGRSYIHKDFAAIRRIEAEDYVGVNPDGSTSTRQSDIDDLTSGKLQFSQMVDGPMQVHVYGNTAIATGRSTVAGSYDGHAFDGTYAWVDTWVQRDGRWQIVAEGVVRVMGQNGEAVQPVTTGSCNAM